MLKELFYLRVDLINSRRIKCLVEKSTKLQKLVYLEKQPILWKFVNKEQKYSVLTVKVVDVPRAIS